MKNFYCQGFQDFKFEHKYDCIWIQWLLMYLTDEDLIKGLKDCAANLTVSEESGKSGLIIVKENVTSAGFYFDREDNSSTRTIAHFETSFAACGLEILFTGRSPWAEECYDLQMWVLRVK